MFLRSLLIAKDGTVIRDIEFTNGLNLIVDETAPGLSQDSGNNVGKTTVLRLVSYCFGASAKKIYADPEFKEKEDPAVKEFLESGNVIVQIRLTPDLSFDREGDTVIERNFLKRSQKIQRIDGQDYNDDEFRRELKMAIFGSEVPKPTVKQIVAKNIREGNIRTENAVKVLDAYTSASEYELLYLFWLGIEVESGSEKQKLEQQLRAECDLLRKLDKEATESQIEQAMTVLERKIDVLEEKRARCNVDPDYEKTLESFNDTQRRISELSTTQSALVMKRDLLVKSILEARSEKSDIDVSAVRSLYQQASKLIEGVQRTFEETLAFHNRMVDERIMFLSNGLPAIEDQLGSIDARIESERIAETSLAEKLRASDAYTAIESLISELNEAYEKRGYYESSRELRATTQANIESTKAKLAIINSGISENRDLIEKRIEEFNKYFARLSYSVYGEEFILSSDWGSGKLSLEISSIGENPGTGKKLGQIALFDLSYIQFADNEGINCLHFIMQDRMENMHGNQLRSLSDIIDSTNCQYILTVLSDKLPKEFVESGSVVLRLSQDDKLFRVS